jgi:hypothetical protein
MAEFVRTWFGNVGREELEREKCELEKQLEEIQRLVEKYSLVLEEWKNRSVSVVEGLLWDLCLMAKDCINCPAARFCKFMKDGCTEVLSCETCPRVRICIRERRKGFVIYVNEGGETK